MNNKFISYERDGVVYAEINGYSIAMKEGESEKEFVKRGMDYFLSVDALTFVPFSCNNADKV